MMKTAGLYIHIPFCVSKCPYCSFYSAPAGEDQYERYTEAVIRAIKLYPRAFSAETIYFGGGTPSVIGAGRLCRILKAARERFGEAQEEITVEANPCTIDYAALRQLRAAGFSRLSLGVQAVEASLLRTLGRRHSFAQAEQAIFEAARAGFEHISADLMIAIPGQTAGGVAGAVKTLAALPIDHLSAYILKIEEGTGFFSRFPEPDGDFAADCYETLQKSSAEAGFFQYEISNFAKYPAAESRHNLNYWRCGEYLGIGPAAHSFMDGRRFYFPADTEAFINAPEPWGYVVDDGEGGSDSERLMLALRLAEGIALQSLRPDFAKKLCRRAAPLASAGLMKEEGGRLAITPKGFAVSNSIIARLI